MDTAKPNRPFYLWLDDVIELDRHNNLGGISSVKFYWACYRRNYSPVGVCSYNMSGAVAIEIPEHSTSNRSFKEKPFPSEPEPDIMMDLGLV
jgi:hypothetical protein